MKCAYCSQKAIVSQPALCVEHFIRWVEETVRETITTYGLLRKDWRIAVAASGGKDSTTILHILHKYGYHVEALAIDEGIPGYRDKTLQDLRTFIQREGIPLRIIRVPDAYGTSIHRVAEEKTIVPCRVCGVWRRRLLEKAAHEGAYDALVTGHNLDDEIQNILMNLAKAQTHILARLKPATGRPTVGFVQRVKPLIFLSEKHIALYSRLKGFPIQYTECPYYERGFRYKSRVSLGYTEKKTILLQHLSTHYPEEQADLLTCSICGLPSSRQVCAACAYARHYATSPPHPSR